MAVDDPQRYSVVEGKLVEDSHGDYVEYSDFELMEEECQHYKGYLETLQGDVTEALRGP